MKPFFLAALALLVSLAPAHADGEPAGEFDYWVLALSWSPNWCELEGDARASEQCDSGTGFGWVLHGLWPQYEQGWPAFCRSNHPAPSRSMTAAQADLFGTGGAAWYQWRKHGSCSGLAPDDYYALARLAYDRVVRPPALRKLTDTIRLPARVIEEAFLDANPALDPDMITITCKKGHIQEARLCLTRDMEPRDCAPDVARDCTLDRALLEPVR